MALTTHSNNYLTNSSGTLYKSSCLNFGLSPHVSCLPLGIRCAVAMCLLPMHLPQSFLHNALGSHVNLLFHNLVRFLYGIPYVQLSISLKGIPHMIFSFFYLPD